MILTTYDNDNDNTNIIISSINTDNVIFRSGVRIPDWAGLRVNQFQASGWMKHPAIRGLRPPEHRAGKSHPDHKTTPLSKTKTTNATRMIWMNII